MRKTYHGSHVGGVGGGGFACQGYFVLLTLSRTDELAEISQNDQSQKDAGLYGSCCEMCDRARGESRLCLIAKADTDTSSYCRCGRCALFPTTAKPDIMCEE